MEKTINDYLQLGSEFYFKGEFEDAAKVYREGLIRFPYEPGLTNNLAACFSELKDYEKARETYERALTLKPESAIFLNNLAVAQKELGKVNLAISNLKKASKLDPQLEDPYYNLGNIYRERGQFKKAIDYYRKSLSKNNNNPKAWNNLGITLMEINELPKARLAFEKGLEVDPKYHEIYTSLLVTLQDLCLWEELAKVREKVRKLDLLGENKHRRTLVDPFFSITYEARPGDNLFNAKSWSNYLLSRIQSGIYINSHLRENDKVIKLGFVSDGFRNFPTGHNIVSLLEKIDEKKFKVYAYSHGINDKSQWRNRIEKATTFRDIIKLSDEEAARLIARDKIAILFDLKGFTKGSRLKIFAQRPAPIQIAYLGFPGTTGATFIDYLIADKIVIPPVEQKYFSEKVLYIPNSYRPIDAKFQITNSKLQTKKKGFIFSSFNNLYKIEPNVWGAWLRILKAVPDSRLMLWESNSHAKEQLLKYAKEAKLDKRIIFEKTLPKNEHLHRLANCNLALDTFITNGHTTTVDNIIAGTPVLTLRGNHFNSRVSASVLKAIKMDELITTNVEDYIKLATNLAKNNRKLNKIRESLIDNRKLLFNMDKYARNFEALILKVYAR